MERREKLLANFSESPNLSPNCGPGDHQEWRLSVTSPAPAPVQTRDGKGRPGNRHRAARARYPEGGCLSLAAPRLCRREGGAGVRGVAAAAAEAAEAAAKQPEPPQRPQLHPRARRPAAASSRRVSLSIPRLLPRPGLRGGSR